MHAVANLLLDPVNGLKTNVAETVNAASQQMDLSSAVKLMKKRELLDDVANLVQTVGTDTYGELSKESLAKARNALKAIF